MDLLYVSMEKEKSRCVECGGSELCEHGKRREYCKDCAGSQICEHREYKYNCKECLSNKRRKINFSIIIERFC